MPTLKKLQDDILKFREDRDWKQFHNPKDVALSLVLEATEYLELFQWKNGEELKKYIEENKEMFEDELADVLYYVLLASHDLGIDIREACEKKLIKTGKKYPIEKSRGNHVKHDKL